MKRKDFITLPQAIVLSEVGKRPGLTVTGLSKRVPDMTIPYLEKVLISLLRRGYLEKHRVVDPEHGTYARRYWLRGTYEPEMENAS